ncbi:hypothetical protein [Blastococcus brunescens]|uniref:Uncharacterized protein n=1 Tax=Blastococcus brunescens TaxID=1564165 RepID=A0ABZ1B9S5_9ACTN|nr:hypothetical protein [Blastococcus sp. BMG 8361]WRL66199.1 hypothetical protein U6N30_12350 [Blastococcus sp. BMG 8361]
MRRLFWLAMGITIGALVVRKLSRAAEKMTPAGIGAPSPRDCATSPMRSATSVPTSGTRWPSASRSSGPGPVWMHPCPAATRCNCPDGTAPTALNDRADS